MNSGSVFAVTQGMSETGLIVLVPVQLIVIFVLMYIILRVK